MTGSARWVSGLGATVAPSGRGAAVNAALQHAGARQHRSILGQAVLSGGFAQVYDAVGSRESVADALSVADAGARVVLVGGPAELAGWTGRWPGRESCGSRHVRLRSGAALRPARRTPWMRPSVCWPRTRSCRSAR